MDTELIVILVLFGLILVGMAIQKPARRAMIRKLARVFVEVFKAHCARQHDYQRGPFSIDDEQTQAFYTERQQQLEAIGFRHLGDTENISLRPILPNGGYFQRHFLSPDKSCSVSLFHLLARQRSHAELIHGIAATTFFDTGTVISSIAVENDQQQIPPNIPSQMIYNTVPFDIPANDFIERHQHEVDLYLEHRQGSATIDCTNLDDVLRLANDKQKMLHDHVWQQGDPISEDYIRQNIDPRFANIAPEIKKEIDLLIDEQKLP